jgi:hypothetical protein
MADVDLADLIALALRLVFAGLLYAFVAAVLLALRRELQPTVRPVPAAPGRAARLTVLEAAPEDGPAGRSVPLAGPVTLGRRPPCEVRLHDDSVSGRHARIVPADGAWRIEDLGSTNGTYVNGRRVERAAPLRAGDVVTTGAVAWRFDPLDTEDA